MSWTFLSLDIVKALHEEQIALFGGSPGLRDAGLLESAIMRAEFKAQYESDASLGVVAGSLGYGLIKCVLIRTEVDAIYKAMGFRRR